MALREIRLFGDPVLTSRADEVVEFDANLARLAEDMLETMDDSDGVGLAANQVGVLQRIFVYDCEGVRGALVNPVWEPVGDEMQLGEEGCLSVPGIGGEVERHMRVRATGQDPQGRPVAIEAEGLLARCIQHETDHLDGVMFMKRMSPEVRKAAMRDLRATDWFMKG
ncbi:peptide deformylase [Corynebacterium sp.]|uniref:peptide deformylase n=1 Tax=Corynebacterium sp. TaxID=1720 RepID=UPI0026DC80B6|nr:peptide deformylase [Corynebacterium sp.]MDO4609422.1 peptide deformylase [Corynebacterium sp.]